MAGRGWALAPHRGDGAGPRGGTINSCFLQPRGRDNPLELPQGLPLCPLLASKGSYLSRSPLRGHTSLGRFRGSFGKLFIRCDFSP